MPHAHVQSSTAASHRSFAAPDHGYPVYLELQLTATDAGGLTATTSVRLDPQTVDLTFRSNPGGLRVTVTSADSTLATPFTHTYVVKSQMHLIAPADGCKGRQTYTFQSWSDGGAADHTITAPATATIYTAAYRKRSRRSPTLPAEFGGVRPVLAPVCLAGPEDPEPTSRWQCG